jgi:hypothetical protein
MAKASQWSAPKTFSHTDPSEKDQPKKESGRNYEDGIWPTAGRKCAGGCLKVRSRFKANTVTAANSQIADIGKIPQAGGQ